MNRDDWDQRYRAGIGQDGLWPRTPHPLVPSILSLPKPSANRPTALDAACGNGRHACWLQTQGWQVTAVDYSEVALDLAQAQAPTGQPAVDWLLADLCHWSPSPRSMDLVLVAYLHTPAPARAVWMQALRDAVRPGGQFLYLGHDLSNLNHGHGGPRDPDVLPSTQEIVRALPGFEVLRAEVVERRTDDDPGHGGPPGALALDALVHAVRRI